MEGKNEGAAICPNCGHPVETHELFDPPMCPVVRLDWSRGGVTSCATGVLTKKTLDDAFAAIARQPMQPRHDCRYDGHVMQWNPLGFNFCIHCGANEADEDRPA